MIDYTNSLSMVRAASTNQTVCYPQNVGEKAIREPRGLPDAVAMMRTTSAKSRECAPNLSAKYADSRTQGVRQSFKPGAVNSTNVSQSLTDSTRLYTHFSGVRCRSCS